MTPNEMWMKAARLLVGGKVSPSELCARLADELPFDMMIELDASLREGDFPGRAVAAYRDESVYNIGWLACATTFESAACLVTWGLKVCEEYARRSPVGADARRALRGAKLALAEVKRHRRHPPADALDAFHRQGPIQIADAYDIEHRYPLRVWREAIVRAKAKAAPHQNEFSIISHDDRMAAAVARLASAIVTLDTLFSGSDEGAPGSVYLDLKYAIDILDDNLRDDFPMSLDIDVQAKKCLPPNRLWGRLREIVEMART